MRAVLASAGSSSGEVFLCKFGDRFATAGYTPMPAAVTIAPSSAQSMFSAPPRSWNPAPGTSFTHWGQPQSVSSCTAWNSIPVHSLAWHPAPGSPGTSLLFDTIERAVCRFCNFSYRSQSQLVGICWTPVLVHIKPANSNAQLPSQVLQLCSMHWLRHRGQLRVVSSCWVLMKALKPSDPITNNVPGRAWADGLRAAGHLQPAWCTE